MELDEKEQEGNFSLESAARSLRNGDLEEVMLKEEVFWRQMTRVKWIKKSGL